MDDLHNNNGKMIEDIISQYKVFSDICLDENDNISLDFIFDTFLNLMLDCKSVSNLNSNKYLIGFYKQYKNFYDKIFDFRMKYIDFNVLKVIGQGAFGQVQLVRHRQTGNLFALKILNKTQVVTCEGTIFWQEEREIMIKIDSQWIVKLHYAFQDSKRLYMVMDYLPGGNLVNWMSKLEVLLEKDVCFYAAEIVLAINGLHQYGFVHRDIKPDNLLFNSNGHMKLADFGSCVKMDPVTQFVNCNRAIGTPDYISPEVLLSQSDNTKYGKEVDWWALGVMLYEIFYGEPPFYSDNLINTYGKIMTHEQSLSFPPDDEVSETALDFMKNLICDRSIRLGQPKDASDIKSHPFFSSDKHKWNWNNIQDFPPPFIPELENDLDTSYFEFDDDDVDKNFLTQNSQELKCTNFMGENLQFSGFSYTRYDNTRIDTEKTSNKSVKVSVNNDNLQEHLNILAKENQTNKDALDKLLIEKKDLENQLHVISQNFRKEEIMSKKLQIDYSELMTKHSGCQRKIEELEEYGQRLSADLLKFQGSADKEKENLLSDIQSLDSHLKKSNVKLMEIQTDYRQSKLNCVNLENEYRSLQKAYRLLESDLARLRTVGPPSGVESALKEFRNREVSIEKEYKQLRSEFDSKLSDLHKAMMENQSLTKSVECAEKEKEKLKISVGDLELKAMIENRNHIGHLKEKDESISDLKCQIEKLKESLEIMNKKEASANLKMAKLFKLKNSEKIKYEQELEDQRNKLSKIITSKTQEIQHMKASIENMTEINEKLTGQIELDKIKQETLVAKINEIIHGKCTTAKEMMISEDVKSGFIGKRSGRVYYQLAKETKKLQSMYDELQKTSQLKETELRKQIDTLTKERDQMLLENSTLQENISYYDTMSTTESTNKRASVSTIASSQGSFDSESSHIPSSPFRRSLKMPVGKPPFLKSSNHHHTKQDLSGDVFHDNTDDLPEVKLRFKKPLPFDLKQLKFDNFHSDFPEMDTHLEVNVKMKGKKMSWEKRFVKHDDQYIYFYGQDMVTCHLKLLFTSLVFIRSASSADVIHAKKSEIPRIFQICYDKNESIFLKTQQKKSMTRSNTSINSADSIKSSRTNSSNDNESPVPQETVEKKATRKGSLSRFIPLIGNKSFKSKENSELSIDSLDESSILLKGHVFLLLSTDNKSTCDICTKTSDNGDAKTMGSCSKLQSHSLNRSSLSSVVSTFQCFHCSLKAHGYHLDSKIFTCKQSVAIQLCRAADDCGQLNWIKYLNQFVRSQMNSSSSPGLTTPIIKSRLGSFA